MGADNSRPRWAARTPERTPCLEAIGRGAFPCAVRPSFIFQNMLVLVSGNQLTESIEDGTNESLDPLSLEYL